MCRSPHHSSEQKGSKASKKVLFSALIDSFSVRFLAYYLHFAPFSLSSLVVSSYFFMPNMSLLAPKTPLFDGCFALFAMFFMAQKGFVYTIAVDIYA